MFTHQQMSSQRKWRNVNIPLRWLILSPKELIFFLVNHSKDGSIVFRLFVFHFGISSLLSCSTYNLWLLLRKVNVYLSYHTDVLEFILHVVVRSSLWLPAAFCPYDMSKCFFCLIFMYLLHLLSSHWGMFWLRMVIGIRILANLYESYK